ncbi:MAG: hypothetical protein ACRD12_16025, partial [Acidimicrobiales bacterium]
AIRRVKESAAAWAEERGYAIGTGTNAPVRPGDGRDARTADLARVLDRLVDASVTPVERGELGRMFSRAVYAQEVNVLSVDDGVGRFRLHLPDGMALSPGRIAAAVDELGRVRVRFPWAPVIVMSFDEPSGIRDRRVVGSVRQPTLQEIHVSADLVAAQSGEPVADLRGVVAHECWHLIEHVFATLRYRDMIRFRIAVGQLLGLPTFEHAYVDTDHATPEQRAAALAEVRDAVGNYATKNPVEGTAELFTAWWRRTSGHRLVVEFGKLVDSYLPESIR